MSATAPDSAGRWRPVSVSERTLLLTLLLVATAVYGLRGFDESLARDAALYLYVGQRVADGAAPYVEAMNRVGPLMHVILGLGVGLGRLLEVGDIAGVRTVFLLLSAVCVPLAYLVGRAIHPSRIVGLAAAGAFISFTGFAGMATAGPQSKTPMVTFVLLAMLAALTRRWTAAGVWTGMATLTWQPAFVVVAGVAIAAALLQPRAIGGRVHALLRFAGGGLTTLALTVLYFALAGALPAFWDGFVTANLRYTEQGGLHGDLDRFLDWSDSLLGPGQPLFWLGVVAVLAVGVLTLGAVLQRRPPTAAGTACLVLAAGLLPALVWSYQVFNGWPDGSMLLPMAAAGVAVVAALAEQVVARRGGQRGRLVLAAAVTAGAVLTSYLTAQRVLWLHEDGLHHQRAMVLAITSALPEDATLMGLEAPQPLAVGGLVNPTRYLLYSDGLVGYLEDRWPGGMQGYADWVADRDVTVLAVRRERTPPELLEVVDAEYVRIGSARTFGWYLRRDQPTEVRAELRNRLRVLDAVARARAQERRERQGAAG